MKRRWLVFLLGLFSSSAGRAAVNAPSTKFAQVGPWEFSVPEDWAVKDNDGHSYLESSDGTVGCYIKAIEPPLPKGSSQALADDIQAIHEAGFRKATKGSWRVVDKAGSTDGSHFRSRLDMLDEENKYRVLSLVLASSSDALHITIHNYWCEDYSLNRRAYHAVESSMRRNQPGA